MAIAAQDLRSNLNKYVDAKGLDYVRDLINLSPNERQAIEKGLAYKGFQKINPTQV